MVVRRVSDAYGVSRYVLPEVMVFHKKCVVPTHLDTI